jgi:hypothetical protein
MLVNLGGEQVLTPKNGGTAIPIHDLVGSGIVAYSDSDRKALNPFIILRMAGSTLFPHGG